MRDFFNSKAVKTAVLAVLSVLYIAGIICLFFNTALGVTLWGAALIPSLILFLYQKRKRSFAKPEDFEKPDDKSDETPEA